MIHFHPLTIKEINQETDDCVSVVFDVPEDLKNTFRFNQGQSLTMRTHLNGEEVRRTYSICSSPFDDEWRVAIKKVDGGLFSTHANEQLKKGDVIEVMPPVGKFYTELDPQHKKNYVAFVAGSGITPAFSMIKTALHSQPHVSVVLVYSNASPEKTIFHEELKALQQQFPGRFKVEFLFSNSAQLSKARLNRELIISYLEQFVFGKEDKTMFYTCGPESYMRLCIYTLQAEGIKPEKVRKENFYFSDVKKRDSAPPDRNDRRAIVHIGSRTIDFTVHYPDSILKSAKKEGFILPYSCEAGRCGNCVARCTKGSVWHSYNEVLTDKELSQGFVLTCVGHPDGDDVELEIGSR